MPLDTRTISKLLSDRKMLEYFLINNVSIILDIITNF